MVNVTLQNLPKSRRVSRRPSHSWRVNHSPYTIQPFCLAPVLPGETLKNLMMQSRVVTDPLNNPLSGWWIEYYWFYVKHRDMTERDEFTSMMIDGTWDPATVDATAADAPYYFNGTLTGKQINWSKKCMEVCVEHYFRNEGEAWDAYTLGGLPLASVNTDNWMDSVMNSTDYETPDVDVDLNADTNIMTSEIEKAMQQWEMLRMHNLTDQTYEQYLSSHGVHTPAAEIHKPELIRYVRDWSYPSNTINPSDGAPSSAVSWSVTERADKDRFFKEPGFIFGVTVARPKIYFGNQSGSAAQIMNDVFAWLPAVMANNPNSSLRELANATGPLAGVTDSYMVDVRDILIYGDQFLVDADAAGTDNVLDLPTAALVKRYISTTVHQNQFFVDSGNASGLVKIRQDGVANFNILGHQVDTTPSVNPGTT